MPVMTSGSYGQATSTINLMEAGAVIGSNYFDHTLTGVNPEEWFEVQGRTVPRRVDPDFTQATEALFDEANTSFSAAATEKEDYTMRIVRIFLVDPDKRIEDLDKRVLYQSDEITTDATDQDLFFDIDVKAILDKHNKYREKVTYEVTNKGDTTEKTGLKPVRVSQLTMSVITIAEF